jgi:SAM-dependent methyltransferase
MARPEDRTAWIRQFWEDRAAEHDATQPVISQVLDPADKIGFKNRYMDAFSKYYVRTFLRRARAKRVLEVGSGVGRLSEYLADDFDRVIGCDLSDTFVAQCNALPNKKPSTVYLSALDHEGIHARSPDVVFTCWVLQFFEEDTDLTSLFTSLREDGVQRFVILEHIRSTDVVEQFRGTFYSKIRSISTFTDCITLAGFSVDGAFPLGEINGGPLYRARTSICRTFPHAAARLAPWCFAIDRTLLDTIGPDRKSLISATLNTDAVITGGIA